MSEHTFLPRGDDVQALSEAQLRRLYDEDEIERFLSLFSTYVTEVRLSTGVASTRPAESNMTDTTTGSPSTPCPADHSLAEHIAYDYLLPHIPPAAGDTPTFTLKRLSLTVQRLYLALVPPYKVFISNLGQLALWKDYQRSLRHCIIFWFLWFHDLLLPALVFRIVFGLLRHRLSAYPALKELQERRHETAQALKFGEAIQQRLSVSTLGPIELWRLLKLYKSEWESKAKPVPKDTIEDDEGAFERDMLHVLNELADLHEKVKNIFTWRRPDASCRYLFFLTVVGFGSLVLPARYVAKLVYLVGGILFWHVTPVIAAVRRGDRTRLARLLFRDAPTDAEYAMELIAKRIAAGQDIGVASFRNQSRRTSNASASTDNLIPTLHDSTHEDHPSKYDGINWKKWSERVGRSKALLEEGRQLFSTRTSRDPISGETAPSVHLGAEDGHTFLAHYASCPGLITLTSSTLFFTPLTATHAKLVMPRDQLRGVRKSGFMTGISITWASEELVEREEKFHWVGNRDELFARLVGSDGRRWITV